VTVLPLLVTVLPLLVTVLPLLVTVLPLVVTVILVVVVVTVVVTVVPMPEVAFTTTENLTSVQKVLLLLQVVGWASLGVTRMAGSFCAAPVMASPTPFLQRLPTSSLHALPMVSL